MRHRRLIIQSYHKREQTRGKISQEITQRSHPSRKEGVWNKAPQGKASAPQSLPAAPRGHRWRGILEGTVGKGHVPPPAKGQQATR